MSGRLERLRRHLRIIDADVAPVVQRYHEHIQCRAGCSQCCHQTFRVSDVEGELLREGLQAAPPEVREDIVRRAEAYEADQRQPCPALSSEGHCRLYEHRPRICRKYGIPLWSPEEPQRVTTCELNFVGVTDIDVELIVDPQAGWAEDWIALREELGIPHGRGRTIAEQLLQS